MRTYSFIICLLFLLTGCEPAKQKETEEDLQAAKTIDAAILVEAMPVVFGNFPLQMPVNGTILAAQKANLHFATSGAIQSVSTSAGDKVEKGQLLATLENATQKNQLALAKEAFSAAKTELHSILLGYSGGLSYDTTNIQPELLSNLKTQAGYTIAALQVEQALLSLEATSLFAPFSGRITGLNAQAFDYISGGEIFCTLINEDNFVVKFFIIETEIQRLKKANRIRFKPIISENAWYEADIHGINLSVDKQGLMQVIALIKKEQLVDSLKLVDGMNANVIVEELIPNQIIIPRQALVVRNNRNVVFTVENGRAKWNYVKITHQNSSHLAIIEGLGKNDSVIITGNLNLAHDARVKVENKE